MPLEREYTLGWFCSANIYGSGGSLLFLSFLFFLEAGCGYFEYFCFFFYKYGGSRAELDPDGCVDCVSRVEHNRNV